MGILPGVEVRWKIPLPSPSPAGSTILMQVPNPLKNGKTVRFANRNQDAHRKGWLTLLAPPAPEAD